jgi:ABC-type cobalamin/Fe3+-siderophores transport system ATPase subunit
MLTVTNLTKAYGGVLALKDLSFTAVPGQVVGLLGPNGSGKSTALNVLTGLLRPTRGAVCWEGRDIHDDLSAFAWANGVAWYVVIGAVATLAIGVAGRRRARPPIPSFDAPSERITTFSLSGATGQP